jgi:hypothetical protein
MKKLLTVLAALVIAASAHAQFGIIAGVTSPSQDLKTAYENYSAIDQYHAGITVKIPLFLGLAIQPSIMYSVQGTPIKDIASGSSSESGSGDGSGSETGESEGNGEFAIAKNGYIQVPVQLQWGIDVGGVARVYAFAEPYVGYRVDETTFKFEEGETPEKKDWYFQNRLNYGVGAGLGVEVLKHIQLSARYVWNMGQLLDENGKVTVNGSEAVETVKTGLKEGSNNGIKVSLAFLF